MLALREGVLLKLKSVLLKVGYIEKWPKFAYLESKVPHLKFRVMRNRVYLPSGKPTQPCWCWPSPRSEWKRLLISNHSEPQVPVFRNNLVIPRFLNLVLTRPVPSARLSTRSNTKPVLPTFTCTIFTHWFSEAVI